MIELTGGQKKILEHICTSESPIKLIVTPKQFDAITVALYNIAKRIQENKKEITVMYLAPTQEAVEHALDEFAHILSHTGVTSFSKTDNVIEVNKCSTTFTHTPLRKRRFDILTTVNFDLEKMFDLEAVETLHFISVDI